MEEREQVGVSEETEKKTALTIEREEQKKTPDDTVCSPEFPGDCIG